MAAGMKIAIAVFLAFVALVGGYFLLVPEDPYELSELTAGSTVDPPGETQRTSESDDAAGAVDRPSREVRRAERLAAEVEAPDYTVADDATAHTSSDETLESPPVETPAERAVAHGNTETDIAHVTASNLILPRWVSTPTQVPGSPEEGNVLLDNASDFTATALDDATAARLGSPGTALAEFDATAKTNEEPDELHLADASRSADTRTARTDDAGSIGSSTDETAHNSETAGTSQLNRDSLPSRRDRRAQQDEPTIHIVKAGETFSSIAGAWFGDESKWSVIARANPALNPSSLQIGQRIILPPRDAAVEDEPATPAAVNENEYTVQSGDTLTRIARRVYGDANKWHRIYEANRTLIGPSPDAVKVGMKLTIPPL